MGGLKITEKTALMAYRKEVPEKVREGMKAKLLDAYSTGELNLENLAGAVVLVMGEVIVGNVPVGISAELRAWCELLFTMAAADKFKNSKRLENAEPPERLAQARKHSTRNHTRTITRVFDATAVPTKQKEKTKA